MKLSKLGKIHVFCNGELAEINYFKELKDNYRSHKIVIYKKGLSKLSPWQLIEEVGRRLKSGLLTDYDPLGDQLWCVFDVDDYWNHNKKKFCNGIALANENGINLAWSNECFELWYLLHFQQVSTSLRRIEYGKLLKSHFKKLGIKYSKNKSGLFILLLNCLENAKKNARLIYEDGEIKKNPSTNIHTLVAQLEKTKK